MTEAEPDTLPGPRPLLVGGKFWGVSLHRWESLHSTPHTRTANGKHGSSLGCPHAPARTENPPQRDEHHEGTAAQTQGMAALPQGPAALLLAQQFHTFTMLTVQNQKTQITLL